VYASRRSRTLEKEATMARITHIAVKVDDLDKIAEFYDKVFGLENVGSSRSPGRSRVGFSDGQLNLTFLKYDSESEEMAQEVGQGPAIHHFGIEVDDVEKYVPLLIEHGATVLSKPGEIPVKFRMPGGPLAELVPDGSFAGGMQRGRG
jgi:catechol 2,3-dioxygenase-like lactoylglutathione lyase family enzyme